MSILRRLLALACTLALLTGSLELASAAAPDSSQTGAEASKRKKKRCRRGYKLKTVKRHGKKVKRCRKVKVKGTGGGGGGGNAPLFEPPGRKLVGNEAVPFLQRYLADSRFTDCPAGWPNCGVVEERYSHFGDGSFYYCRLGPTPGSDIKYGSEYLVENAVVEANGSWTFNESVPPHGSGFYEWHVAVNGIVNGAYQFNGGAIEQLGPFQYVSGARDCSY